MRILMQFLIAAIAGGAITACDQAAIPGSTASNAAESSPAATARGTEGGAATATAGARGAATPAVWREVTIPAGTTLPLVLDTPVASDTSRIEDPVRARLSKAVVVDGVTALPEGSVVNGVVTDATRAGKVKGTSHIGIRFDTLTPASSDERYQISTGAVGRSGPTQKKKDALEIGAPAAGGAIVGGIIGGKKGAAIGAAAGGGAGTAVVMSQRGEDVRLGRGAAITLRLAEPLTVRIRG